jgi:peptide/nickel transport system substrate-binding protein
MLRRTLLTGAAAAASGLAMPSLAQPANARTLIFVPQANLTSLDPVWTTATVTRNFAYLVYDTLYGVDDMLQPQPQMAAGHTVEDDGRRWTITLRPGLTFHDGSSVRARDCAASIARWMKRDSLGQTLAARLDAIEAPSDTSLVFRLKKPFASLAWALGKSQPSPPVIMPERLANTDAFKAVSEVVGSGPFRFVTDQYVSGSRAIFARFDGYVPRDEPANGTAGGKRAMVERVEWRIIPEAATAAAALRAGEVDWVEQPLTDLLPQLRADRSVVVDRLDPFGLYPVLRFNTLQGPTANRGVRQAILAAINPVEVMQAVMGDDATAYHAPIGCFLPGTPYANSAEMDRLGGQRPVAEIRQMLADAKYDGSPVVLLHPTDQPYYDAMAQVTAATLKRIGVAVDDAAMDFGTVVQRRASKAPLDKGGWSLFSSSFPALDYVDPLGAPAIRGNGAGAWFGWPTSPEVEQARDAWLDSGDPAEKVRLAATIQGAVFREALYVPMGQYFQSTAWQRRITGQLRTPVPVFWNLQKA